MSTISIVFSDKHETVLWFNSTIDREINRECKEKTDKKSKEVTKVRGVYAFDLDGTLISSIREKYIISPVVKKKLQELYINYDIVIFSNQARAPKDIEDAIYDFIVDLDVPIRVYVSLEKDKYRKPEIGMWNLFISEYKKKIDEIVFVGDAAGRDNDFSDSDKKFVDNIKSDYKEGEINITFKTPEEVFGEKSVKAIDLSNISLVILVGYPASGKSTLALKLKEENFEVVNQDTLGKKEKCVLATDRLLKEGKKVVIDNCNCDIQTRKLYINLAKQYKVKSVIIKLEVSMLECMTRNERRVKEGDKAGKTNKKVPKIVFYKFRKNYEEPSIKEGIDEVIVY